MILGHESVYEGICCPSVDNNNKYKLINIKWPHWADLHSTWMHAPHQVDESHFEYNIKQGRTYQQ